MADKIRTMACRKTGGNALYKRIVKLLEEDGKGPEQGRVIIITEKNEPVGTASTRKGARKRSR